VFVLDVTCHANLSSFCFLKFTITTNITNTNYSYYYRYFLFKYNCKSYYFR